MAQSALNCGNQAVRKMGGYGSVTSIDGASDTSKEALFLYNHLDDCRKQLLRRSPWNFAIKRKIITPPASFAISNVTYVSSTLVEITHATASYSTGQYVTITGVAGATGANGTFEIQSAVGATVTRITCPLVTSSAILGTYTSGGYIRLSPAFDYSYLYTLPTDCLRFISCNEELSSDRWLREGGYILSDVDTSMMVKYVKDETDYTAMDVEFYDCLSTYVAWQMCEHISGDDQKKRDLYTDLFGGDGKVGMLPKARFDDASEDSTQYVESNSWILARGGAVDDGRVTATTSTV